MKLSDLEIAFKQTKQRSTPHRHPDFAHIREVCDNRDPDVRMDMVFIEEHNTGYDGVLWRYICRIKGTHPVVFQVDLMHRVEAGDAEEAT